MLASLTLQLVYDKIMHGPQSQLAAAVSHPGFFILLAITAAVVWWAWDSRPRSNRPPSTYGEEGEDEE